MKTKIRYKIIKYIAGLAVVLSLSLVLFNFSACANNLEITNPDILPGGVGITNIQFDVSWENSWRDNRRNYDAVWIFIKYQRLGSQTWEHATLLTRDVSQGYEEDPPEYSTGDGDHVEIILPDDNYSGEGGGKGCFIQPSGRWGGNLNANSVQVAWHHGYDGILDSEISQTRLKIYGIEMVYVPKGDFYLGDGDGTSESLNAFHKTGEDASPKAALIKNGMVKITWDDGDNVSILGSRGIYSNRINFHYPTGYRGFYIMKYEISQGQYKDFLNALTVAQQETRTEARLSSGAFDKYVMTDSPTVSFRQTIKTRAEPTRTGENFLFECDFTGNGRNGDRTFMGEDDGECIAMNYINYQDLAAFADWAGLRPITELEYEKACRGQRDALLGEYAWGTNSGTFVTSLYDYGKATESASASRLRDGWHVYLPRTGGPTGGPMRGGFAGTPGASRLEAGASCWGIMNLSGNVGEIVISLNEDGRNFRGSHGDGMLSSNGNANQQDWPGFIFDSVKTADGTGWRGGIPDNEVVFESSLHISNRVGAGSPISSRASNFGGRLARTAPF